MALSIYSRIQHPYLHLKHVTAEEFCIGFLQTSFTSKVCIFKRLFFGARITVKEGVSKELAVFVFFLMEHVYDVECSSEYLYFVAIGILKKQSISIDGRLHIVSTGLVD